MLLKETNTELTIERRELDRPLDILTVTRQTDRQTVRQTGGQTYNQQADRQTVGWDRRQRTN